ncbi:MAG: glycosyltransferase [Okeania sp. SIO3I5]|nr:glycosyltransferase [Okeania sp. SIO3I5]
MAKIMTDMFIQTFNQIKVKRLSTSKPAPQPLQITSAEINLIKQQIPIKKNLVIVTSIAAGNEKNQLSAIESWQKSGFNVVSLNNEAEINRLEYIYKDVTFYPVKRDAKAIVGRPLIYVDDLLLYLKQYGTKICGIINSDIRLEAGENFLSFISQQAENSVIFGSRVDIDSFELTGGKIYERGFDIFFFDKLLLEEFPISKFCLGLPWWDLWIPSMAIKKGLNSKYLVTPVVYHLKHKINYSNDFWQTMGIHFADFFNINLSQKFQEILVTNPRQLQLELTQFAHHTVGNIHQKTEKVYYQTQRQNRNKNIDNPDMNNSNFTEIIDEFPAITSLSVSSKRPFFSVMIPTYKKVKYLEQTLKSVLQQAPSPEEMQIEVVNDCPDVKIQSEIEAIVRKVGGERVNFYRHFPQDIGQAPIFNICLQRAQGYWIHLLHDDDFVLPGFYEKLRQVIERNTTVGAAFCRHSYIDENNNQKMVSPLEKETPGIIPNWLEKIVVMQRIQCASMVVKRSVYEKLGGFCLEAKSAADWEIWKRIAAYYPVSYEPQILACYRLHSTSETSRLIEFGGNISDTRKAIEISESYLPKEISKKLSDLAREHYALSATKTAQQMLSVGKAEVAIAQIQEALKCSNSSQVKEGIISLFVTSDATPQIDVNQLLSEVSKYVQEYQKDNSNKSALNKLRQVRQQIANYWLNLPTEKLESVYLGDVGRANQKLISSNIKYEQISETEKYFVEQIATYISQGLARQNSIQYLLAATLYYYPHQLSPKWFVEAPIPKWFVNDYIKFMIDAPNYFQEIGEADKYYRYTFDWINYLHQRIFSNSDSKIWQDMAWFVTQKSNFIPLYFNNENLKDIYIKRAEIMELGLQSRGFNLDYVFPERAANRNKIRLGILSSHFIPQTETFSTLPFFEHLDKTKFEIILYAKSTSEYPLEKYCQSCTERFIKLPDNLISEVETIRNDDLDILLIGTNVTAITNPITLLALHRLARIQVTSTSSCVTTGMRHIDYYISGKLTEPPEEAQQQYQEKLITLKGAAHCFNYYATEPEKAVVKPSRESWGVNDKNIVFVSGANFYKIIPELRETWAKIIAAVPNSILVLYPFNPNWSNNYQVSTIFVNDMRSIFKKYGIDQKRLIVIKTLPSRADIKECLKLCDVYLDSYPFAGVNSLIEPLEIQIPIVTKDGNSFRSLMGSALLRSLSIPDLIADSEAEYINLAIKLANNSEFRQQKQQEIQEKMQENPSFLDSRSYSAQIGELFQELFQEWQNVHLPKTIESQDNNSLTSEFINRLVGCVNLYKIDPTDQSLIEELRQLRKQIADFWLDVSPKELETIYQGKVRQAYLALLASGIQNEPQTEEEEKFLKELADTSIGLTNPKGINALLGGMLYFPPGKMLVRDAKNRLPQWLINDYKQVFESREVAQKLEKAFQTKSPHLSEDSIGRGLETKGLETKGLETKGLETKGLETKPLQVNVVLTENKADNLDSANQKFLNQLLGSVNLYYIDPSDESVVKELRQLRKQTADFWINLEPQKLETFYLGEMGKGYQELLNSQIQNESLIEYEQEFLQELATQLSQGIEAPKAINYLLAAMLYCRPQQLQIEDMDKLPHWLLADYQKFAGNE